MEELHIKYRPAALDDIIGQDSIVKSIYEMQLTKTLPHSYIFTGPSGCGKTTIARILGNLLECEEIIEIDGATHTGVDDMRNIAENLKYRSFHGIGRKLLILDEAHQLSSSAWNSWLKITEEPPEHLYLAFCTTEFSKIPKTIVTRCHTYQVRPLDFIDTEKLLLKVMDSEKIELSDEILDAIIESADGSPRQALVYLSQVRHVKSIKEAKEIIGSALELPEVIDLCREIATTKGGLLHAIQLVNKLKKINPESIRIQIVKYLSGCVLNSKTPTEAVKFLMKLEAFEMPYNLTTGLSNLLLSLGEIYFKKS